MRKKIAVILSGCGFKDGAAITEAVAGLIALSEFNVSYDIFAPNMDIESKNHLTGDAEETRNVLTESARIARGNVVELDNLSVSDYDAVVFPGGFGAALNLCDFGINGAQCSVLPKVESIIKSFHEESKPIAAFCIAPALIARVLGEHNIAVTIGNDKETLNEIEKTGAQHVECAVNDFVSDREHKVITTPAYMYEAQPFEVYTGIRKAIKELVEMA